MSKNCCYSQIIRQKFTSADVGKHQVFLEHNCECGSCCRRVAVWQEKAPIDVADTWLLKAIARVTFGCRKWCTGSKVEVDIKTGVILDLMGDFIEVEIEPVEVEGSPPELLFGAMSTCCGAGGARGCATRTFARSSGGLFFPIPPYAYAVSFAVPPTDFLGTNEGRFYSSTTSFVQSGSGFGGFGSLLASMAGDDIIDPWPIIAGAQTLGVFDNGNPQVPIVYEVVFHIGV